MATISSPGIGSGLDVKSIVSQLVAIEKQPLEKLKLQAATVQTKISAFGQIKSMVSTLADAAGKLTSVTGWNAVSATSSNSSAVSATAIGGTLPTTFSVEVQGLAKAQATASASLLPVGGALGAGTLRLELGQWSVSPASFTPGAGVPVDIDITASDTVFDIASKINGADAGVTATVLSDASGERLLLRGKNTGEEAGFRLSVTDADGVDDDANGLSRLVAGSTVTQAAENAHATVNGIAVTSATNTFANTVAGVTFKAEAVTTAAVDITIAKDNSALTKNIDDFVAAYNAINELLSDATKYDGTTKQAGLFQGDSTAIGLQNALRSAVQSVSTASSVFQRLADVGITQQLGGNLAVDSAKLAKALEKPDEVKNMFRSTESGSAQGIAVKIKALTTSLLSADGFFKAKDATLQLSLDRNAKDQTRVSERAQAVETQLNRRYSALDTQLASLNALNAYISQQVTAWNKSKE
ncbi:MAG: flagellar filament capping protein FliD [Burkholderiaceae bacterium]|nr:flagellar filament capping protein FliD [Burkholderiaceae bacterium]